MKKKMDKVGFASTIVVAFTFVYLIIESIYKLLSSGYIGDIAWEAILLFSMVVIFSYLTKDEVAFDVPRSLLGQLLPLDPKKKKDRANNYLKESMVLSLFIVVINICVFVFSSKESAVMLFRLVEGNDIYNIAINSIIFFIIFTVIFYAFDYYVSERNVSIYTKLVKSLNKQEKEMKKSIK